MTNEREGDFMLALAQTGIFSAADREFSERLFRLDDGRGGVSVDWKCLAFAENNNCGKVERKRSWLFLRENKRRPKDEFVLGV